MKRKKLLVTTMVVAAVGGLAALGAGSAFADLQEGINLQGRSDNSYSEAFSKAINYCIDRGYSGGMEIDRHTDEAPEPPFNTVYISQVECL